jgi:glycosyltransferase involved in cell wall biosynthesis
MNPASRVSVVIPTFNRVYWLVEAVESVLNQSFEDFGIVVVDDGSTDATAQRSQALEDRGSYIQLEHSGHIAEVRNRGIGAAWGDLAPFLDNDDAWLPGKLDRQIELLCRRCSLYQIGRVDGSLSGQGDEDFWFRLACAGEAGCISEPLVLLLRQALGYSQPLDTLHYRNAILFPGRWRKTRPLKFRKGLISPLGRSRQSTHVGLSVLEVGEVDQARRHVVRSLCSNPRQRRGWVALKQSYSEGP